MGAEILYLPPRREAGKISSALKGRRKEFYAYFEDYLRILPENAREENKKLDESFLSLVNKVQIKDESFLALKIEDPFFGRITDMKDMLG